MKKLRYILFVFLMMILFPFWVMADDSKEVHWNISGTSLHNYLQRYAIYNNSIEKIIFNDISSTNIEITDGEKSVTSGDVEIIIKDNTLYIQFDGTLYLNANSSLLFAEYQRLTTIEGLEYVNTSKVTNMSYMFYYTSSLKDLDLRTFDVSNVTNMSYMFNGLGSIESNVSLDLTGWDTGKVVTMYQMFKVETYGDYNTVSMDIKGISDFDTSNVTDMSYMFQYVPISELDLSKWNTSKVTNMSGMFNNSKIKNLNIENFDTSEVTNMSVMFGGAKINDLNIKHFDTSQVTDMGGMFSGVQLENLDLSNFDTSKVTDMSYMFSGVELEKLDLSNFNTSNVINMIGLFYGININNLNVDNWDISKVTDTSSMFSRANLDNIDFSKFDFSNVTDMSYMFSYTSSTGNIDFSKINTSNVTDMSYMFEKSKITSIDLSKWDTSKVKNMSHMFYDSEIRNLNVNGWDTSNVSKMSSMFAFSNVSILDLSSFNTFNVLYMDDMFFDCIRLEMIYVSDKWSVENVISSNDMFDECWVLRGMNGTMSGGTGKEMAVIDSVETPGYLSIYIGLTSDEYTISDNYIYTGYKEFDANKINIDNKELATDIKDDILNIYYKDKIIKTYDIVSILSSDYDLSKKYILSINELFDINKINTVNSYVEINDKSYELTLYHKYVKNDRDYITKLGTWDIVNIISKMQDVTEPYLYAGAGSVYEVLETTNAKQMLTDDGFHVYYDSELLFRYDVVFLQSEKYDLKKDYIYTENMDFDLDYIEVDGGILKYENNKLNVYYKDKLIKSIDVIMMSSDTYNFITVYEVGYIYVGHKQLDLSKINISSGTLKYEDNRLKVYYGDELVYEYIIVSVSSDKYEFVDDGNIYVGEDYTDYNKILSGIKVINGIANISNGVITINIEDSYFTIRNINIITAITDVSLNGADIPLSKGDSAQVIATINPWNTLDDKTLTWINEDESVAKFEILSSNEILITPVGIGTTYITVTTKNGKSATVRVVVSGFNIEVESNSIYVSYDGKEHQVIPNVKTSGSKITYSLDGVNYNLNESPKFKNPGQYKVYYKVEVPYYEDYYGDDEVKISGILSMPSNMIIKNKYLIINNYDNSLYRLMRGINLYALSDFFEYRYDGGLYQPGSDYSGSNQFLVSTGKSFWIYIDSALEPMYSYDIVLRGDLSGDGDVDSLDLATMMNHISGKKELMGAHLEAAYLNNDEDIDSLDLAYLMNHIAGKEGY